MREAPAVIKFMLKKLKHVEYGCKPDDTAVSRVVVLQKRKSECYNVESYFGRVKVVLQLIH